MNLTQEIIKGMSFRLSAMELRELTLAQAKKLARWLEKADHDNAKLQFREALYDLLLYAADNLERSDATYELSRWELQSLFEEFDD